MICNSSWYLVKTTQALKMVTQNCLFNCPVKAIEAVAVDECIQLKIAFHQAVFCFASDVKMQVLHWFQATKMASCFWVKKLIGPVTILD